MAQFRDSTLEQTQANSSSWKDLFPVSNVEPKVIVQLLAEVETFMKVNAVHGMAKKKLLELRINDVRTAVSGGGAEFDAARWSRLSGARQDELLARLTAIRNDLINGINISPSTDDTMFGAGVSTKSVIWLAIFGFIFVATLLSLIR